MLPSASWSAPVYVPDGRGGMEKPQMSCETNNVPQNEGPMMKVVVVMMMMSGKAGSGKAARCSMSGKAATTPTAARRLIRATRPRRCSRPRPDGDAASHRDVAQREAPELVQALVLGASPAVGVVEPRRLPAHAAVRFDR